MAFTKAPARSAFKIEPKPVMTGVFFALPVEPQEALAVAEAALPEKIARINEPVPNAACGKRVKEIECVSGRVEGEIVRNGPIELTAKDGKLLLEGAAQIRAFRAWTRLGLRNRRQEDGDTYRQQSDRSRPAFGLRTRPRHAGNLAMERAPYHVRQGTARSRTGRGSQVAGHANGFFPAAHGRTCGAAGSGRRAKDLAYVAAAIAAHQGARALAVRRSRARERRRISAGRTPPDLSHRDRRTGEFA